MTTQTYTPAQSRLKASRRNLTLWTFQGWLAMFFIAAGYAKLSEPIDNLVDLMRWPAMMPENAVRGLGVAEIVLALMLLAPLASWRFGRAPMLTAAAGLGVLSGVMLGVHAIGMDVGPALTNVVLLALAGAVLWMRSREAR